VDERRRWDERYAETQAFGEPHPVVVEELERLGRPGRALDVAAGAGRHAWWLAERGWQVVAADFSEVALGRAKAPGVHPVVADVHALPLPPARFDLVLAAFFHPRPAERPALYPKLAQALAPAGTLLLVTYDVTHPGEMNPDFLLDPPAMAGELRALGLQVERADTVAQQEAVLAVIRATRPPREAGGG
jgi:SAM-dependent methyltransferase